MSESTVTTGTTGTTDQLAQAGIEALRAIDRERRELRQLVEAMSVCALLCDRHLTITRVSGAACESFGLDVPEGGVALDEVVSRLPGGAEVTSLVRATWEDRRPRERVLRFGREGRAFVIRTYLHGGWDRRTGRVIVSFTAAGDADEDDAEAAASLREADRRKDEFLAMLSHELRNPLAAIRNATELLGLLDDDRGEVEPLRGVLDRQTRQMAKLTDDLLNVSRVIRGKLVLRRSVIDLGKLLRELVEDRRAWLAQRQLSVELHLPDEPMWTEGDEVRLTEVFDNVLSNSAKFTPEGGHIQVTASLDEEDIEVRLADDGIGIEPESLPHVCEAFRQTRQAGERSSGGLGLGLALVRGLVELHGGGVEVESEGVGCGTAVTITLARSDRPGQVHSAPSPEIAPLRVLLVEDNEDMAATLAALLARRGHDVSIASTGREGIERARAMIPDVVLSDIGLGGEFDGFDVARAIRTDDGLEATRLVAVTGHGDPQYQRQAIAVGFDACLIKPVTLEALESELRRSAPHHGWGYG